MTASVVARETARTLSKIDLTLIDDEPRVYDLRLADALGFTEPRAIRKLIIRNLKEIVAFGPSGHRVSMVEIGSGAKRPITEYYLNEAQALLICMFARTERAAEVRKQLIEVFMAWRRGETEKQPVQQEYVPVLTLAQQIDLAVYGAKLYLGEPRRDEILEHVFLALRTAEQTRMMKMAETQPDMVVPS